MVNHQINSDQIAEEQKQIHHQKEIIEQSKVGEAIKLFIRMDWSEILLSILSFVSFTKQKVFP